MRALVVAEQPGRRDTLAGEVRDAGHEVIGSADATGVTAEIWRGAHGGPDVMVVDLGGEAASLRRLIDRARHAAEQPLPVLLLLPDGSAWLRGALPRELLPAVTAPSREADSGALARALAQLDTVGSAAAAPPRARVGSLSFDPSRRDVSGPDGSAHLTPSEAAVLGVLVREEGGVVPHGRLAQELWGTAVVDRHSRAAIRSHVHTLRGKLRAVGLGSAVASLPGVGYRLVIEAAGRPPV